MDKYTQMKALGKATLSKAENGVVSCSFTKYDSDTGASLSPEVYVIDSIAIQAIVDNLQTLLTDVAALS